MKPSTKAADDKKPAEAKKPAEVKKPAEEKKPAEVKKPAEKKKPATDKSPTALDSAGANVVSSEEKTRSPATPRITRVIPVIRETEATSPCQSIPSVAVPVAPSPVQTAYALPIGSVRTALASGKKEATMAAMTTMLGPNRVNPCVAGSPDAQATSKQAETRTRTQAIDLEGPNAGP